MQIIAEFLMAVAVWIAAVVLSQFGVQVDLSRDPPPTVERVAGRDPAAQSVKPAVSPCPDGESTSGKAVRHAV